MNTNLALPVNKKIQIEPVETWGQLPIEEKLRLLLAQSEWIVFKAVSLGLTIDKNSLKAVMEAKRLISGWPPEEAAAKAIMHAFSTFIGEGASQIWRTIQRKQTNSTGTRWLMSAGN